MTPPIRMVKGKDEVERYTIFMFLLMKHLFYPFHYYLEERYSDYYALFCVKFVIINHFVLLFKTFMVLCNLILKVDYTP